MAGVNSAPGRNEEPAAVDPPLSARLLDLGHLGRQTDGDKALQGDLLGLFQSQAQEIAGRIGGGEPVAPLAHRLKGAARAVGAWAIAEAAGRLEEETGTVAGLQAAIADTLPAISRHLAVQPGSGTQDEAPI